MFDTRNGARDGRRTGSPEPQAHGQIDRQAPGPSGGASGRGGRGGPGDRPAEQADPLGGLAGLAAAAGAGGTGAGSAGGDAPGGPGIGQVIGALEVMVGVVRDWLALLDTAVVPVGRLETAMSLAAQLSKAADGLVTIWTPVVVDRDTTPRGEPDATERIARHTGRSRADVRRRTRLGRRLDDAPEVKQRLVDGRLSRDQAAPIAEAVAAATKAGDPDAARRAEADLVGLAEAGASVSEIADQAHRRRQPFEDTLAARRRQWATRSWTTRRHTDGSWCGTLKLPVELGAIADGLITKATGRVFNQRRKEGRRDPWEAYAAEAVLALLARGAHNTGVPIPRLAPDGTVIFDDDPGAGRTDGHPGTGTRTGQASLLDTDGNEPADGLHLSGDSHRRPENPLGLRLPDPAEPWGDPLDWVTLLGSKAVNLDMLIRVDLTALRRGHVIEGEACEIAGVGPVDVSVAQQLLGQALLNLVITDGVDVQTAVVAGRRPTKAMWLALLAGGDPRCVDCGARFTLELDHTEPYAVTRHTTTGQLEWRCKRCHLAKTRREAPVTIAAGRARAQAQRDGRIPPQAAAGSAARTAGTTRRHRRGRRDRCGPAHPGSRLDTGDPP